ncbi:MAG: tetratricopeptide repeat protein [candidate division Zixibacteria bacterium]|nr:tetratricopeptide repeat protein [candidate division Zixibacteria bacterium]
MKEQQKDIPPDFSKDVSELAKKDSKTAIEDYERIMNRIFDEEIYRTMAYNYYLEKKYDESTLEIKKALKLNPDNFAAYYNWGVNSGKLGRYEESIEKYRKATELNPDYGKAWYNIACAYSLQNMKMEALENLKKAIELDPNYKEKAKKDEDFKNLWQDEDFKKLVE